MDGLAAENSDEFFSMVGYFWFTKAPNLYKARSFANLLKERSGLILEAAH
jgi:hypothetical protein